MNHDFRADLEWILDTRNWPLAFVRGGDGERAIINGYPCIIDRPTEMWQTISPVPIQDQIAASMCHVAPDYYVGISCPCCDDKSHRWYLDYAHQHGVDDDHLTYSNLFVNGNHEAFLSWASGVDAVLVSSSPESVEGLRVPRNAVNEPWDIDNLVARLCVINHGPIFVAAGPASNAIIHRYWTRTDRKVTILDIGSSLDPYIHGCGTRGYHQPDHPNRHKMCRWST